MRILKFEIELILYIEIYFFLTVNTPLSFCLVLRSNVHLVKILTNLLNNRRPEKSTHCHVWRKWAINFSLHFDIRPVVLT